MKKSEFDARVELSRLNLEKRRLDLEERKISEAPRRTDVPPGTAADGLAELLRGHPGAKGERGEQGPAGIPGIDGQHGERGADGRDGADGARGEDGADGLDGRDGAPGPQGPVGPQGPKGDPGVPGIVWRGNYQSGTEYAPGDAVAFEGSSWVTRSKTTARPTLAGEWDILAKKGDGGAVGGARPMSFGPSVASAISVAPSGALTSTNVQDALVEVQGDVDLLVANAHDPVTVTSPTGWLSILNQALTFALVAASDTVAGVVSIAAQNIKGVKTFLDEVAASAGVLTTFVRAAGASLVLRSSLGAAAADECVVIGSSEADGTVHADAKLLVVKTGIGGVPVERFWATKARAKVKVAAGLSFADPVLWFETSGANQTNIIQFGSGVTSTSWEFALGWYGGALAPFIQSRSNLYFSTSAGGFVAPISPNVSDLGSTSNHWRRVLLGETLQLGIAGTARPAADAASRGTLWYSKSAAGAADTIQVCLKSAADTYSWVTIGTG